MKKEQNKLPSNRSFGILFFLVFLIIGIYPLLKDGDLRIWSLIISTIFLILGLLNSSILYPLNKIWMKFGYLLGAIIAPIVMALIFFGVVTPTGIFMKIIGKDLLNLKKKKDKKTYWIKKEKLKSSMKNQF
jgi:predicted membrane metal-binding protein